jgi:hypothetical protein
MVLIQENKKFSIHKIIKEHNRQQHIGVNFLEKIYSRLLVVVSNLKYFILSELC